ncbi:hypothetical protein GF402_01660 [Candidatus Fermentibacteria bacterium]|nr:hypothetical protein [Candidatus Fermentibacteria bacterium]
MTTVAKTSNPLSARKTPGLNGRFYYFMRRLLVKALSPARLRCVGRRLVPDCGPALLAPNHVSWLDVVPVGSLFRRPVRFAASRNLFDRNGDLLSGATRALLEGDPLCIFPEGRLRKRDRAMRFKLGTARILTHLSAEESLDVPTFPVAIRGTVGLIYPAKPVRVRIGPPIYFADFAGDSRIGEAMRAFTERLTRNVRDMPRAMG